MTSSTEATPTLKRVVSQLSPISGVGKIRWPQTILLYFVSHGFILASWNALYWDDWLVYANGPTGVEDFFASCTRCVVPFRSEVEGLLISPGPWLMRVLTFLFFPLITFFSMQFLRRTGWMREDEIGVVSLLILFLPMYGARVAHIDFHYSLSLLIFMLGVWMLLSPRAAVRISAVVPIFWSMFTPSLQVFVVVPIAVLLTRHIKHSDKSYLGRSTLIAMVLIGLSPLAHRFLIPIIFPTLRVTDGYNMIQPAFLMRAVVASALLVSPLLILLKRQRLQQAIARESWQLCLGLAILAIGAFPYLAVGHFANFSDWILPFLPDESDWNSRHQLLQPFGFAFILLAASKMFGTRMRYLQIVILTTSVMLNVATFSGYYLDSIKQSEVITSLETVEAELSGASAIVIRDDALRYSARGRSFRSFEWSAMFSRALKRPVSVDSDSLSFCEIASPTKTVTITSNQGRLKSMFLGRIGLTVEVGDLSLCS